MVLNVNDYLNSRYDLTSSNHLKRPFEYDTEMVLLYLLEHPRDPSLETMRTFTHPDVKAEHWDAFIRCNTEYVLRVFKAAGQPMIDGLPRVSLKEVYVEHVGHAVELEECVVAAMSSNRPEAYKTHLVCLECGDKKQIDYDPLNTTLKPKWKCSCSDPTIVERVEIDDMFDTQWVRLQEKRRDSKFSRMPFSIMARIQGRENMWRVQYNELVRPIGVIRSQANLDKNKRRYFSFWFEVFAIKHVKDQEHDIELNDQVRERIRLEMTQEGYLEKLRSSIAPQIAGMDIIKDCAILTLASIGLIHPIKVLVIGDPGTGKSDVMEYASLLLPRTFYVDMANTRGTGLTTTSRKDEDTDAWMVDPGLFALADGSAVWIDDLQEAKDPKDITALLGVIQRGKIKYALAGGNVGEFDANCALMIATNPTGGYIGGEENIHELLAYIKQGRPQFLSRMSIIIQLRDKKTPQEDEEIAGNIYDHSQVDIMAKYKDDYTVDIRDENGTVVGTAERFGTTTLRQIFKYIIEEVPVSPMPPEFRQRFIRYYLANRKSPDIQNKVIVTPRFMAHCVSVAQVFARLFGRSQPEEWHVMYIFEMLKEYMKLAAYDPKTNTYDVGQIEGTLPQRTHREQQLLDVSEKSLKEQFEWGCKEATRMTDDPNGWFTPELLRQFLNELPNSRWLSDTRFKEWFDQAENADMIKRNKEGRYMWNQSQLPSSSRDRN